MYIKINSRGWFSSLSVRKDMDVIEHDWLSNFYTQCDQHHITSLQKQTNSQKTRQFNIVWSGLTSWIDHIHVLEYNINKFKEEGCED